MGLLLNQKHYRTKNIAVFDVYNVLVLNDCMLQICSIKYRLFQVRRQVNEFKTF
jgi:hypothetical protein